MIAINVIHCALLGYQNIFDGIAIEAQISGNASAVSVPFVPEDTTKECNKKPRCKRNGEGGYSHEKCERKKSRSEITRRTTYVMPPLPGILSTVSC